MKIVVIGGIGPIGSQVVSRLTTGWRAVGAHRAVGE